MVECLIFLLTATCADDVLWWDVVPEAHSYHIEAHYVGPSEWGLAWEDDTVDPWYPVGCTFADVELRVWGRNHIGLSPEPATFLWKQGGGRYAEFSTHLAPLCGGP